MGRNKSYKAVIMTSERPRDQLPIKHRMRNVFKAITVEPLMFVCVASAVFKFVVLPQFLLDTICHREYTASICTNITSPENSKKQIQIQASAAQWMLGLFSCSLSISLFTVPLLGSLADVVGKKRVLFVPIAFYTLQSIVYSALSYKIKTLHPAYLIICAVLGGLSGDIVALTMLTCSYISDITTEEQRTFRITLLDGILNLSLCVFIFISGYIIVAVGYAHVFFVSLGIDVLALLCLAFFVPDDARRTRKEQEAQKATRKDENESEDGPELSGSKKDVDAISINGIAMQECVAFTLAKETVNTSRSENEGLEREAETEQNGCEVVKTGSETETRGFEANRRTSEADVSGIPSNNGKEFSLKKLLAESNPIRRVRSLGKLLKEQGHASTVIVLLITLACASMCIVGESFTLVLYIKNHPFNMNSVSVGYLLSFQGLLRFIGGYTLLNAFFQRCSKLKDINVVSLSFCFNLVYFLLLGFANTKDMLYGIQALGIFGPLAGPTLRSVISKKGDSKCYATILSIALTVDTIASFIVNILVNSTYATMVELYPGTFCFVLAGISVLGLIMSFVVRRCDKDSHVVAKADDELDD